MESGMRQKKDPARQGKSKLRKRIDRTILAAILFISATGFMNWAIEDDGTWRPDYPRTDLSGIVGKTELTDADYHTIYMQTGLGKDAADELLQTKAGKNRERVFAQYLDSFFTPANYDCRVEAVIVHSEQLRDTEGKLVQGFDIPDLRDGDILITKATHSLGWRHGHAAFVTDAAKGEVMEAFLVGNPTILQNVSKWRTYPSFIHLRLKNHEDVDTDKIAEYAKKTMLGVPYGLLTGIPVKAPEDIKETQCAHVVWYPYEQFGFDLDSDGSWLVTPKDIANSDLLEVVQVYGIDPEEVWP
jgi:uncharacterized protein YycO